MNQKTIGTSTFDVCVKKISTGEPAAIAAAEERRAAVAVDGEREPTREEHDADAHRDRERARDREEHRHVSPRVLEAAGADAREAAEVELAAQRHDREPRHVERQVQPPVEVRILVVAEEPVVHDAERLLGGDVVAVPGVDVRETPVERDQHERERGQHDRGERAPLETRGTLGIGRCAPGCRVRRRVHSGSVAAARAARSRRRPRAGRRARRRRRGAPP